MVRSRKRSRTTRRSRRYSRTRRPRTRTRSRRVNRHRRAAPVDTTRYIVPSISIPTTTAATVSATRVDPPTKPMKSYTEIMSKEVNTRQEDPQTYKDMMWKEYGLDVILYDDEIEQLKARTKSAEDAGDLPKRPPPKSDEETDAQDRQQDENFEKNLKKILPLWQQVRTFEDAQQLFLRALRFDSSGVMPPHYLSTKDYSETDQGGDTLWWRDPKTGQDTAEFAAVKKLNQLGFLTYDSSNGGSKEVFDSDSVQRSYITGFMKRTKFSEFMNRFVAANINHNQYAILASTKADGQSYYFYSPKSTALAELKTMNKIGTNFFIYRFSMKNVFHKAYPMDIEQNKRFVFNQITSVPTHDLTFDRYLANVILNHPVWNKLEEESVSVEFVDLVFNRNVVMPDKTGLFDVLVSLYFESAQNSSN